jgi:hypothetical protein
VSITQTLCELSSYISMVRDTWARSWRCIIEELKSSSFFMPIFAYQKIVIFEIIVKAFWEPPERRIFQEYKHTRLSRKICPWSMSEPKP